MEQAEEGDHFDYVVVGSGAAGSIVAARLAEAGGCTVCVLEAGPMDHTPFVHIPAGFIKTLFNPAYTWQFKTAPAAYTAGRQVNVTQGRVLGGSGSVNGMIYNRGQPADFDEWAQRGNRGWGYADLLPYFRKSERRVGFGSEETRGRDGAVPVTDMDWIHPVSEAFIAGAEALGIPRNPDYNSGDQAGVGYYQRAIHRGWRLSSGRAYLMPAVRRGRVDLRTNARACGIVLADGRATGVRYLTARGGTPRLVHARREVIVSAGTANTARLLQLSGIGPEDVLRPLGIEIRHGLPGVGQNLRDHYSIRAVARAKAGTVTLNELARGPRLLGQIARWALGRPSILATVPSHVYGFWMSRPGLEQPDLQIMFSPGSYKQGRNYVFDDYPGMTVGVSQHRPHSSGWVRAVSSDLWVDPEIQPNYLKDTYDQDTLLGGLKLVRRLLAAPELSPFVEAETLPGRDVTSDEDLLAFARENGASGFHLIGTARMGPSSDPTSVVDDRLRVHGLRGLRVIDASIMPNMPSANTYASSLMIGEKGADLVKEDARAA
ncbi:GMC family oxidoreductase [Enterovirga rhinocerotis]|uniref:Choline dehydrogenase n=1 Tax=Enterovirga rhinocerotis TaxID=1339210 RepID=A0A4R7C6A0_9HYPH|nr:GMC family oxidoreductase [Enterovirga rhinocerotis]TDR93643.1 choline dehydrogenase [Enterovirga rhinocerotis]